MRSGLLALLVAVTAAACGDDSGGGALDPDASVGPDSLGTACDDGIDNDGDGKIDFPLDPGCVAPNADDEADDCPDGEQCPQCGNGRDDDGNGSTDYPDDPGCTSASDPIEAVENIVACGASLRIENLPPSNTAMGSTAMATSTSTISSPCGGGGGSPAVAYRLNITEASVIVASTSGSTFDTVLDLRSADCDDPAAEVACNDNSPTATGSDTTSEITQSLAVGTYYLIVQGRDSAQVGDYTLTVEFFTGEGNPCTDTSECGPSLVCRTPVGGTADICTQPQCNDTLDDDADGKIDYPFDPGCMAPDDNDETDPSPLPQCGDGLDNDADGDIDYPDDVSCQSASGDSEACSGESDVITAITTPTTSGTLIGATDDHDATCDSTFSGSGPDKLHTIVLPALVSFSAETVSDVDTVLSLLAATCMEPSLACDDESGTNAGNSLITMTNLAAGAYVLAVDAYSMSTTLGTYDLVVSGELADGASCEPANTLGGAFTCQVGSACSGTMGSRTCTPAACGNGLDDDSDGKIDFPFDPGCTSVSDPDETDPTTAPACSNGTDDDTDTLVDFPADYGCSSAAGTSEVFCATDTDPKVLITQPVTTGSTATATDNFSSLSCAFLGDSTGEDVALALQIPVRLQSLVIDTVGSNFDSQLSFRDAQCGTEIACNEDDELSFAFQARLDLTNIMPGGYSVIIDGYQGDNGTYSLTVEGVAVPGAACGSALFTSGVLACPTGTTCTGTPARCQ